MDLDQLQGELTTDVAAALAFLNLIVQNNPDAEQSELEQRPDVREAQSTVLLWLAAILILTQDFPEWLSEERVAVEDTVARMRDEILKGVWMVVKLTNLILVRFQFLVDWLRGPIALIEAFESKQYTKKTWISQLTWSTCTYCRRLHGTTIPITASFAPYARAVGWTRVYGDLRSPGLHPRCRCTLIYS